MLSVPPLTNGWETRNALDTPGAVLLEASSDAARGGADVLRALLADLVRFFIEEVETDEDSPCVVLVEPVDVVCAWNRSLVRASYPEASDFEALPPLSG